MSLKTKYLFLLLFVAMFQMLRAQTVELHGTVISENDIENIHIINKTLQKFTVTNAKGAFVISGKLNDTLVVSSIQSKLKTLVISMEHVLSKKISISLEEHINELDEVVVGKILTGDLLKDIDAVEGKPITAKGLGIPSYQGPIKLPSERALSYATSGMINTIINTINGKIKRLEKFIVLEENEKIMYAVKTRLSEDLFSNSPLEEEYIMDYFYFVSDAENFKEICTTKSDLEILVFLKEKLEIYKANRKIPSK